MKITNLAYVVFIYPNSRTDHNQGNAIVIGSINPYPANMENKVSS